MSTPNMETAQLLANIDMNPFVVDPREWTRRDGQPLTDAEREALFTATEADLQAAVAIVRMGATAAEIAADAARRLVDLVTPYWDQHPELTALADIEPHLTPEDRETFHELASIVQAAPRA